MNESELRRAAQEVRDRLEVLLDGDTESVARLTAEIDAALALPRGRAKRALRSVLFADPRVHEWVQARIPTEEPPDRLGWVRPGAEIREDTGAGEEEEVVRGPGDAQPGALPPAPPRPRHLHARMPDRVEAGRPISLIVAVTLAPRDGAVRLKDLVVPPEGLAVTVVISAPGLTIHGEPQAAIHVPADADSEPYRFALTAGPVGLHTVTVEAFQGGTYLGAVSLQVSVERSVTTAEERVRIVELPSVAAEPGEVTLQVRRDREGYRFQLIGDAWYEEVTSLMGDATTAVSQLAKELREMAANRSPYTSPRAVRRRVRQLGIALWTAAVPETVQRQFWEQADRITMFTIAADNDTIPWEMLYPRNDNHDNGFLAEQFPVLRRAYGTRRIMTVPLTSAAYVVPEGSPTDALEEVTAIQQRLGAGVTDRGVLDALDDVADLVLDSPSLLHFACHNMFSDAEGSSIKLAGGPWRPTDLADAVAGRAMTASSPLVFLNACRSSGESDWFSQMSGWAKEFMKAGAGAFIGSLWAVRSSAARTFAEAFYQQFVTEAQPLGAASLGARKAIGDDDGDPTWLAYSVYGNPAAMAAATR